MKWSFLFAATGTVAPAIASRLDTRQLAPHLLDGRRPKGIKGHNHPNINRVGNATFEQMIDHRDPENDNKFPQRYWYDAASWHGEGSPIFLFNPGETDAEDMVGYLSNETLPGMLADLYGGAVVVLERGYFLRIARLFFPVQFSETGRTVAPTKKHKQTGILANLYPLTPLPRKHFSTSTYLTRSTITFTLRRMWPFPSTYITIHTRPNRRGF